MTSNFTLRLTTLTLCGALLGAAAASAATIQVTNNITGNVTWRSTNEYMLNGFIYVLSNAVLNIEPGTVIRGKAATGLDSAALIVTAGGKIFANGTRGNPIIFTSETDDLLDPNDIPLWARNLWGGVVILGRAVLNTASDANGNAASPKYDIYEGLPDTQIGGQYVHRFGGNDDNDNSGVLRYVSIRYSSTVILPNKEINGLSLGAVGRGTTIENVEVFGAGDDAVEFFGGTVNTKYMLSVFCDDDNFDIDQGYSGKNQFWFVLTAPDRKDNGGEWNGEPSGIAVGASPVANFEIYNATYIGAGTNATGNRAFISREYAAPRVFNSIFTEFNIGGNIDARSGVHFTNGLARFAHNIFWNFATNGVPVNYWQNAAAEWALTNAANSNLFVNPQLRGISRTNSPRFRLDPRPLAGSPALTGAPRPPNDGFYVPVTYRGAFDRVNWAADWTFTGDSGLFTGEGAGNPLPPAPVTPPTCNPPVLGIVLDGANVQVSFPTQSGCTYRLQAVNQLPAAVWPDVEVISGTGGTVTRSYTATGNRFFRVQLQ